MTLKAEIYVIIVLAAILVVAFFILRNQRRRSKRLQNRFKAFRSEEERLFLFLHDLAIAIEQTQPTSNKLSEIIVDGIDKVITARGGAIYLIESDPQFLIPSYISESCPPLVGIPVEIQKKAKRNASALESYIRLSRIPIDEGILGHCLSIGQYLHVKDLKYHPALRDSFTQYNENVSALIAPLRYAGKDLGVLAVARRAEDGVFTSNEFNTFRMAAEQSSFAIGNARLHRIAQEKTVIERELRNARDVQRILLPQADPRVSGFRISGMNLPARIISGDYYDYLNLNDHLLGIVIADVSGKGLPAGLLMAMCRSLMRSAARETFSASQTLAMVNRQLFPDIREDMFISMSYSILNTEAGSLTTCRAGHDPALLYRWSTNKVEMLRPQGLALGVDQGSVFERVTQEITVNLQRGDCVLFYTDGIKEAVNAQDEEFGIERLCEVFRKAAPHGAETIMQEIQETLFQFTGEGPQMDDITMVVIEKHT
ncbi:MAG: GAF domain-containing protein [Verrucomicrobia bacterium]|nr:MAG: GAF domain-containing protein [Verrucomicrobiota bacterium]